MNGQQRTQVETAIQFALECLLDDDIEIAEVMKYVSIDPDVSIAIEHLNEAVNAMGEQE